MDGGVCPRRVTRELLIILERAPGMRLHVVRNRVHACRAISPELYEAAATRWQAKLAAAHGTSPSAGCCGQYTLVPCDGECSSLTLPPPR